VLVRVDPQEACVYVVGKLDRLPLQEGAGAVPWANASTQGQIRIEAVPFD
jgi:hypothetical protein